MFDYPRDLAARSLALLLGVQVLADLMGRQYSGREGSGLSLIRMRFSTHMAG